MTATDDTQRLIEAGAMYAELEERHRGALDKIAELGAEVARLQADVAAASAEIANLTAERERLLDAAAVRGIYPVSPTRTEGP